MKVKWLDHRTKQWECCGLIWQLMFSKLYPERRGWTPTCPICGSYEITGKSKIPTDFRGVFGLEVDKNGYLR